MMFLTAVYLTANPPCALLSAADEEVVDTFTAPATKDSPRNSEGDIIVLKDGSLRIFFFGARVTPTRAGWRGLPPTCLGYESTSSACIEACQNSTLRETSQQRTPFDMPLMGGWERYDQPASPTARDVSANFSQRPFQTDVS